MVKDTDNAGPTLFIIAILTLIATISTTSLRLLVRRARHALGGDDWCVLGATVLAIGRITCQFISIPAGNGRHRWTISVEGYQKVNQMTLLTQLFLFPILCLLKISVCLLVLRIKSTKKLRWGLWALIALLVTTTILPEVVLLAECTPFDAYWKGPATACWNPKVRIYSIYVQTAASVLADIVCTLLPIAVVWDLSLSLKNKIAVCGLMSLGVISTAFAVVRAASLGLVTTDTSWTYGWSAIWGDLELGFGILGANLALSRTYWDYLSKSLLNLTHHSRGSSHNRSHPSAPHSHPHNAYTPDGLYIPHNNVSAKSAYSSYGMETFDGKGSAGNGHRSKIAGGMGKGLGSKGRSMGSLSGESDEVPLRERDREGRGYGGGGIKREVEFRVEDEGDGGSRDRGPGYAV